MPRPGIIARARAAIPPEEAHRSAGPEGARALAVARVAAALVLLGLGLAGRPGTALAVLAVAGAGWLAVSTVALLSASRRSPSLPAVTAVDILVVAAGIALSGGAASELRYVLWTAPALWAAVLAPRAILWLAALTLAAYATAALTAAGGAFPGRPAWMFLLVFSGAVSFAVLAAVARLRARDRIATLAEGRRRLLAQAAAAEERERRRLSAELHDEPLQLLLVAGQDLDEALEGDEEALARARESLREGAARLRRTVQALHPGLPVADGGLADALQATASRLARVGRFTPDVVVEPEAAGVADELVLSMARELLTNAAKHAHASQVRVTVRRRDGRLEVEVADDGIGMPRTRRGEAVLEGHFGLATLIERADAAGGSWEVASEPGEGTRVRVTIPPPPPAAVPGA